MILAKMMRMNYSDGMDLINGKRLEKYIIKTILGGNQSLI